MFNLFKILSLVFISIFILSIDIVSACAAELKELAIGFAIAPPYADDKTQSGFEVEVIQEALSLKGYKIKTYFFSRKRAAVEFSSRTLGLDGISVGTNEINDGIDGYYAVRSVPYYDYAITLEKNHIKIDSIKDLRNKKIIAFQMARYILGQNYYKYAVGNNPNYFETSDQKQQPLAIFSGRMEVSVGDANIFNFFTKQVKSRVDTSQKVIYHNIFISPENYKYSRPAFRSKKIRDDYNLGLKRLKKTGRYQQLFRKYQLMAAPIDP